VNTRGYVQLLDRSHPEANNNGYVLEHRIVMAKVLGRPLRPEEVVHHRDKNLQNNHPDNLELFASHSAHLQSCHKTHPIHRLSEAGRQSLREKCRARFLKPSPSREVLEKYAVMHNVSVFYLSREKTFPESARALLRKELLQGLFEAPPSSYLERASASPEMPIPRPYKTRRKLGQ
jgi:hypothetical protein